MPTSIAFGTFNGLAPDEGPKALPINVDMSVMTAQGIPLDFFTEETTQQISFIQSIYIDNADNASAVTLTCNLTGHRIRVKANTQGFYPLCCTDQSRFVLNGTASAVTVRLQFLNVPVPIGQWATV
jgi:hypothetical protein